MGNEEREPAKCPMCGEPLKDHTITELAECRASRN